MTMPKEDVLKEIMATIEKKYGQGSVMDLSDKKIVKPEVEFIGTGLPSLDMALGGGLPKGRIIELYGQESSGKSTIAIHFLAQCQKAGKRVAYIDVENCFDIEYAKKLGLDTEDLIFSQPNSGEQALDIVEKLCQSKKLSAIVIDSVAQLVPMSVAAKEIDGTANIGTTARLLSQTLPRLSNAARDSGTILIFINQIRMKIGVFHGNPETTTGGWALKFAASIRLAVSRKKAESRNGEEGQPVVIRVKKNKHAPPFRETELFLVYNKGFDSLDDTLKTAATVGIIEKSGSWFIYDTIKAHGWNEFADTVKKSPEILEKILQALKTIKL